jgi:hypothetical protein
MNFTKYFISSTTIIKYEEKNLKYLLSEEHNKIMFNTGRDVLKSIWFPKYFPKSILVLPSGIHTIFMGSKVGNKNKISDLSIGFVDEIIRMFINKKYNERYNSFDTPLFFTCNTKKLNPHTLDKQFLEQSNIWKNFLIKKLTSSYRKGIIDGTRINNTDTVISECKLSDYRRKYDRPL